MISHRKVSQELDVSFIVARNHVLSPTWWRREVFSTGGFRGVARGASRMNGLEIFERRSAAVELRQWNRSSIVFHRTSANRVSNFDRRRATWTWPFVFGDFPGFSKGGSLDFSRPNLPHCSTHWIERRRNEVFSGDPFDPLNRYTPIMGRENFVISPMEIPFETFS